jgi:hypothetical protein
MSGGLESNRLLATIDPVAWDGYLLDLEVRLPPADEDIPW